jgi:hypothetical protein
MTIDLRFE